jgi:hypothetical protein
MHRRSSPRSLRNCQRNDGFAAVNDVNPVKVDLLIFSDSAAVGVHAILFQFQFFIFGCAQTVPKIISALPQLT